MRIVLFPLFIFCLFNARAQTLITKQQAFDDLDSLVKITEEVHYNPYRYISKKEFYQKTDSLKKSLPDSISVRAFLEKLFQLTALLEDGHSAPAIGQKTLATELTKNQFLPCTYLTDANGQVYIKSSGKGKIPAGAKFIGVNGLLITQAKKKATGYIGGLPTWKREFSDRIFSYFLYLQGIQPPFTMIIENNNKRDSLTVQEGVDFTTALAMSIPGLSQPAFTYKVHHEKLGYINFVSMSGTYDPFFRFLDSAFADMQQRQIHDLAIDLRHNTGGNSNFGEILLAYITSKNFALSGKKKWKISRRYKDYLLAKSDSSSAYLEKPEGSVWEIGSCGEHERKVTKDTIFDGHVYFLTGPLTFSSANMLADGIKQYKLATIVGEPTGESTNDFGEVYSFVLPNSKLRMNTTTSFDVGADCNEKHNQPVYPDVLINYTAQHILSGKDPVLEYVWEQVRSRNVQAKN